MRHDGSSYVEEPMKQALADHKLVEIEPEKEYRLMRDGTSVMSMFILFRAGRVILAGDCPVGSNGVVSMPGYGCRWFAGQLSEDYLCEKFLRREFVPSDAAKSLREESVRHQEEEYPEIAKDLEALAVELEMEDTHCNCGWTFAIRYSEITGEFVDIPGWSYNPAHAGWLCAIQQRFRELCSFGGVHLELSQTGT